MSRTSRDALPSSWNICLLFNRQLCFALWYMNEACLSPRGDKVVLVFVCIFQNVLPIFLYFCLACLHKMHLTCSDPLGQDGLRVQCSAMYNNDVVCLNCWNGEWQIQPIPNWRWTRGFDQLFVVFGRPVLRNPTRTDWSKMWLSNQIGGGLRTPWQQRNGNLAPKNCPPVKCFFRGLS